jgi:dihydroflavonol-4-reductase
VKVLVTGANGFLASNIIRELVRRNIEVRGMVRSNSNLKSLEGLNVELFKGKIVSQSDVMQAVEGCDVVIHAAANTSQYERDPMALFPTNVEGTRYVVEAVKKYAVKRLIFVSTVNTIGLEKTERETETEAFGLSRFYRKSGYAMSKLAAEQLILNEVAQGNLDAVIVKPSFMLGAYDAKPSSGRIILMYLNQRLAFIPPGGKNFVDVTCVATAICNAIDKGQCGKSYVLAGVNLRFSSFVSLLYQLEIKPVIRLMIPTCLLQFLGLVGSALRTVGVRMELNYYNAVILTKTEQLSGEEAEKQLDMPKTDLKKAISEAVSWFKTNNYLD